MRVLSDQTPATVLVTELLGKTCGAKTAIDLGALQSRPALAVVPIADRAKAKRVSGAADLKRPLTAAHHRHNVTRQRDPVDIDRVRPHHPIHVDQRLVATLLLQFFGRKL